MKIEFTGTWPQIRNEIQAFAVEHLNLKFSTKSETPEARKPGRKPKPKDQIDAEDMAVAPGETVDTIQNEPAPKPEPPVHVLPPPPTLQLPKTPEDQLIVAPVNIMPPPEVTKELCTDALTKVYNEKGMDDALSLLQPFGVNRVSHLKPDDFDAFYKACMEKLA